MNFLVKKAELAAMLVMIFGIKFPVVDQDDVDLYWEIVTGQRLPKSNLFPIWRTESSFNGTWFRFLVDDQEVLVRTVNETTVKFVLSNSTTRRVLRNMLQIYGHLFVNMPKFDISDD